VESSPRRGRSRNPPPRQRQRRTRSLNPGAPHPAVEKRIDSEPPRPGTRFQQLLVAITSCPGFSCQDWTGRGTDSVPSTRAPSECKGWGVRRKPDLRHKGSRPVITRSRSRRSMSSTSHIRARQSRCEAVSSARCVAVARLRRCEAACQTGGRDLLALWRYFSA
jgi:hypothetical protein